MTKAEQNVVVERRIVFAAVWPSLVLAGCGISHPYAECTRIRTGEVLRGHANISGTDVVSYTVLDRNGLEGQIDATTSDGFICRHEKGDK